MQVQLTDCDRWRREPALVTETHGYYSCIQGEGACKVTGAGLQSPSLPQPTAHHTRATLHQPRHLWEAQGQGLCARPYLTCTGNVSHTAGLPPRSVPKLVKHSLTPVALTLVPGSSLLPQHSTTADTHRISGDCRPTECFHIPS